MTWFRFRLGTLLWWVAVVAVFLGGVRYGEYREAARAKPIVRQTTIVLTPAESAEFESGMELFQPAKPDTKH